MLSHLMVNGQTHAQTCQSSVIVLHISSAEVLKYLQGVHDGKVINFDTTSGWDPE